METICPPALIYVIYMAIHVVVDIIQGNYNSSLVKIILLFVFGIGLNMLCEAGYMFVAWILIFVPFVLMSLIVVTILFLLKKKETTGNVNSELDEQESQTPILVLSDNHSIQPTPEGCVIIIKHDLTTHGMRAVGKNIYCPAQKIAS